MDPVLGLHRAHEPMHTYVNTNTQGGYVYNAAGLSSFQFCPVFVTAGTWAAFMAGAYVGIPGTLGCGCVVCRFISIAPPFDRAPLGTAHCMDSDPLFLSSQNITSAGWIVWIYSPLIGTSGIEVYYGGVGGSIFVGESLLQTLDVPKISHASP